MSLDRLSERSQQALQAARTYAADMGHRSVTPAHLALALLHDKVGATAQLLQRLGADADRLSQRLHEELRRAPRDGQGNTVEWDPQLKAVLEDAGRQSRREKDALLRTSHLLLAIADGSPGVARRVFQEAGVTRTGLEYMMKDMRDQLVREEAPPAPARAPLRAADPVNQDGEGSYLARFPHLQQFGRDLTQLALDGRLDPVVGRATEIRRLIQILGRRSKNNPVLVGEAGVGKTSVVYGFVHRIAQKDVPSLLQERRVVELDMGALVAGTSLRGQFEERIRKVIQEVNESEGQILLYIDDLHLYVGGQGESGSAAGLLKPALARGQVSVIGTTTPSGFRNQIEKDKALERLLQGIQIEEPDEEQSLAILRGVKQRYEIHHRVRIMDAALVAAVRLARRYVMERLLPDKAVDLMDEAASRLRMQIDSQPTEIDQLRRRLMSLEGEKEVLRHEKRSDALAALQRKTEEAEAIRQQLAGLEERLAQEKEALERLSRLKAEQEATQLLVDKAQKENDLARAAELKYGVLGELQRQIEAASVALDAVQGEGRLVREDVCEEDVATVVAEWTGVPATRMLEGERQKLLAIEERLGARVIGQMPAVQVISAAVRRSRAGVQERNRPIGNFFFVGPTGVGKTELAKALAEFLFDSEDALVRIDMSEYMEQSKVNSLIGAAFGYVDSDRGGLLTEAVRQRPYAVVLFDEAEKAHPDVFNILLQVLDEGRLTDSQGRKVDFTNTIIIMTSNVGARRILDLSGRVPYEELDREVHTILRDHFKPEFLNRLDDTVVFNALDREAMDRISRIMIRKVRRLLVDQEMDLELTEAARQRVIDVGFQPEFGARPLRRALLTMVQDPLALLLLEERFVAGDRIVVDVHPDNPTGPLTFRKG